MHNTSKGLQVSEFIRPSMHLVICLICWSIVDFLKDFYQKSVLIYLLHLLAEYVAFKYVD